MGKNRGFTFLQVLITLSMVLALVTFNMPKLNTFLDNSRLKQAAEDLYFSLQFVRSEAIKKNTDLYVILSPGSTWCYGIHTTNACSCSTASSCLLNGVEKTTQSTTYRNISMASTISGNVIQFEGDRAAVLGTGSVDFSNADHTVSVEINSIGRVKICSSTMPGYNAC